MTTIHSVTRCRAKNPAKCKVHGVPDVQRRIVSLHNQISSAFITRTPANVPVASGVVGRAASVPLGWVGKKPAWWSSYVKQAERNPLLGNTPELLDVIDSPAGKLAVVWQQESQEKQDAVTTLDSGMGLNVCYYKSVKTGETLGYVKMCFVDEKTMERSFGKDEFTTFRWMNRFKGGGFEFEKTSKAQRDDPRQDTRKLEGNELIETRRRVWLQAQRSSRGGITDRDGHYVPYWSIEEKHIPDDEQVTKDLKKISRKALKEEKEFKEYYKHPYVDFSRVEEPLKGKGFGASLYVYTARKLAQQGKTLRGSGIQSDDAQGLWGRFKTKLPNQVKPLTITYKGETKDYFTLDFRG